MIVVAVEESPLLVAVDGVVGGVEVEDQVLGRLGVSGDELIDQDLGARDQRLAVDAVLQAAEGRGRGEGQLGIGASSGGHLQHRVGAEGLMVVEILVAQGDGDDPLGEQRFWSWTMKTGWRGSGMAASRASKRPMRSATSRSSSAPASVVRRPPWKSATTVLGPRVEKRSGSGLQSVIAMALRVEGIASH